MRVSFAFLLLGIHGVVSAEYSGSPALPASSAGYVDYAVTNLPSYYAPGSDVGDMNNTPGDNPITDAGATLGRVLFYDKRLSHNNSLSCSSCHQQETGFTDPNQFSTGFAGGLTGRHSMGLSNAMFYQNGRFFWDERADTLEDQVLAPIENSVEMGSDLDQVRTELAATYFYPSLFNDAFGSSVITNDRISKALAQFVRSMVSYGSKLDTALAAGDPGTPEFRDELTSQELLGRQIFHGSGKCATCHSEEAQVATRTHNIGLDLDNSADEGAGNGRFKVPSLRNISVRDGYMHDGRFDTLEEVIDFYSTDIQDNPNLAADLRDPNNGGAPIQFNFTQTEKDALIAYLDVLTDNTLLTSEFFSDPFVELAGDFDDNGLVDEDDFVLWNTGFAAGDYSGSDFLAWQANVGTSWQDLATELGGDFDNNGVVDARDLELWETGFPSGQYSAQDFLAWQSNVDLNLQSPMAASISSVPEPSTSLLLMMGCLLGYSRRIDRTSIGIANRFARLNVDGG